ncbi:uncharacterized protein L201_002492 [Kwoniella dendrophila CBS 6074]|uniref:Uncharacterized protein n=1 Tax=Kwoniella dendrophila CBS 6074 TaxID=1295534 RepID=A0AAX4JQG1_9TREE
MAQQQQIAHQDAARRQILVRQLALQDRAAELARMEQRAQLLQQQRDNLLQIANNRRPGSPANPRLHNDPIIGRNVRAGLDTLE